LFFFRNSGHFIYSFFLKKIFDCFENSSKKGIDQEMAEIEPLLAEARAAVSDIRNEALAEIRSLRAPPDTIRDILEGVLRLMGILDTSWTSMKSFLAKRGVKEEIR
jgi:dynein heavy chain 2, cytosolic